MCGRGLSKNIPHWQQGSDCWCSYQALGTKQFSTSSSPHVRQVTSTSYQSEGVLRYEKLWYLFNRYLHVSPDAMQKCILHDSVRYQNIRSRDPITLLSMDIVFETFLEIGVSDLLVSTRHLQDPLHGTMRNILILKYWARKAKFHDISRYLADHVSCRVTHLSCRVTHLNCASHICVYFLVILSS